MLNPFLLFQGLFAVSGEVNVASSTSGVAAVCGDAQWQPAVVRRKNRILQ